MRVKQEHLSARQHQTIHAGIGMNAGALTDDLVQVVEMKGRGAPGAADQAIGIALVQQHGANQRQTSAHFDLGDLRGHPAAFHHAVVSLPEVAVALILLDVDYVVVELFFEAQAELLNALGDDGRPADQGRAGQSFVNHDLAGAQHALFLAFGVGHAFAAGRFGGGKDGLHHGAGGIDEALQLLAVSVHVQDGAQRHTTFGRRLGHGRRDLDHQTRVKGLGNQVFRAESQRLTRVSGRYHFALLCLRQFRNGVHRGNFHLHRDGRGTRVQRTAKNIRKAQDVVDLVGVIGATCRHDGVITHRLNVFGCYFRVGVGQGKNDGLGRHFLDHVFFEHAAGGQAQKNIGALNHLTQCARRGFLGKQDLVLVHQLGTAFVNDTGQVGYKDILTRQTQFEHQVQTRQSGRTSARCHQFDLFKVFSRHFKCI